MEDKAKKSIVDILVESWRIQQFTSNLMTHIVDPKWQKKWQNQSARYRKHMKCATDDIGFEVLDFMGEQYVDGLPVYPINLGDFEPDEELVVEMTFEPTIKLKDSADIIHKGSVVLGRKNS